ncbi:MAG: hypothetical protein J6J16_09680 [Lachnospiraceae bacterium]|nr:hypothetical protein [Lachnospiraceae bacterium]
MLKKNIVDLANKVAGHSKCIKLNVGCVIFNKETGKVYSTGYNRSLSGCPECRNFDLKNHHDIHMRYELHAEWIALIQFLRLYATGTIFIDQIAAYVTVEPCETCMKLLIEAGIKTIYYGIGYRATFSTYKDLVDGGQIGESIPSQGPDEICEVIG